ncbi:MAG TPA: GNAT family N-acetyltransferase [Candidatus Limnocylindrales bacterium]|nr:GNAT family N-acetyltransferase [Candidatus Limnocylindrales bacterium]
MALPDLEIVPLTAETWPALTALFEEGGDPRWCWCQFWRSTGFSGTAREIAAQSRERLEAQARSPRTPGLVALTPDGAAVGWVSVGPREDFEHLERSRVRPRLDDLPVWAIVCFVVGKRARRQGVGAQLLDGAIAYARGQGAPALEAYPVDTSQGKPTGPTLYTGTLSTFLRAGFRIERQVESKQATVVREIVRLDLR